MKDATTTTQAANQPDLASQLNTLAGVVTKLAESQAKVVESIEKLSTARTAEAPAVKTTETTETVKPLTLGDVQSAIKEALQGQQQQTQKSQQRQAFVAEKLKDLPPVYQSQLGDDPAQWPAEEQRIRQQFQADFKIAGGKVADVGGKDGDGKKPLETVDTSKLTGYDLIGLAVKNQTPMPRTATAADATAATTTAAATATK